MNAYLNEQLSQKQKALNEVVEHEDWDRFILLHERPYRVSALLLIAHALTGPTYWSTLRWVWEDSENIWQNRAAWRRLLTAKKPGRHAFMTDHEHAIFETFPPVLEVFRGCKTRKGLGWSWTLLEHKAEWFATRFTGKGLVLAGTVPKNVIVGFLDGRGEAEIVIDPKKVQVVSSRPVRKVSA